jgi:hypothetical protein
VAASVLRVGAVFVAVMLVFVVSPRLAHAATGTTGQWSWSTPIALDPGQPIDAISCPSPTQCTAVDDAGNEITLDPSASSPVTRIRVFESAGTDDLHPKSPTLRERRRPFKLHPGLDQALIAVSCPSITQCSAALNGEDALSDRCHLRSDVRARGPHGRAHRRSRPRRGRD